MTTPEQTRQILAAMQNYQKAPRTRGARIRDAINHCREATRSNTGEHYDEAKK